MASLKKCIEQHCKNCSYDHAAPGTWREQVELCGVISCALYPVRPMTVATIVNNRKVRNANDIDIDALVNGLPDDEDEDEVIAADPVA